MTPRYTSQGTEYVCRSDPGRVRHTGARFERKPDTRFRLAVCAYLALATAGTIAASLYFIDPHASDASQPPAASSSPVHGAVEAGAMGNRGARP